MYTPHEIRAAIRNCNTLAELQQIEFQILMLEAVNYSPLLMYAFNSGIMLQRYRLTKKTAA